jgi:hypothetical protein
MASSAASAAADASEPASQQATSPAPDDASNAGAQATGSGIADATKVEEMDTLARLREAKRRARER